MKGLLLKDLYQLIKNCKAMFIIDIVFSVAFFFSDESNVFILFPVVVSGILPVTLLSLDERCGWTVYSGTLPYSEGQIVSEKYLIGLIVQGITSVIILAAMIVRGIIYGGIDIIGGAATMGVMFCVPLVFPAFCLPFCFKFGTEKGRIAYYVLTAALGVGLCVFAKQFSADILILADIGKIVFVGVAIVLIYVVSWIVSVPLLKSVKR